MKPPDPKPLEQKHILAVKKTALKNIVGKDPLILGRLQDAVLRTHTVVFHTTHFLKLYLLHLYHTEQPFPILTPDFLAVCMRTVSNLPPEKNRRGRPPNASTKATMQELEAFHKEQYDPLLGNNPQEQRVSLYRIGDILQYEEKDILKNIKNNIFMHFADYCKEWVNKVFNLKERLKLVDGLALTENEKKLQKRNISIELRQVKDDLLAPLGTVYQSNHTYHVWLNTHKPKLIFKDKFLKNNLIYDLKAKPLDYLPSMIHICCELEKFERHVHCIPLRTSSVPSYTTIDTTTLIMLMVDEDALTFRKKVKESKEAIWNAFFKMGNKAFHRKDYKFHGMIKTDGVGASVLFHRKDQNPDKLDEDGCQTVKEKYIDELESYEHLKGMNVVGIDVGMDDILHCTDGELFYRYTANQRRMQTKKKKYAKMLDDLKKQSYVNGMTVKEWETVLSLYNKFSCTLEGFKAYLADKLPITYQLQSFYRTDLLRKLRWYSYINCQRSEAKMINLIKTRFGEPDKTIIAVGDWDQKGYHMAGKEPTKGKGMRKTLRQAGYEVYLVDEFRTSCTCHDCHHETTKCLYRESHKPKTYGSIMLVHGLLRCNSANGCGSLWNRDVNGCLNIRMLALEAIAEKERPIAFRRGIHAH